MADYLPALRFRALTPLFDAVARGTTRERSFKPALIEQAALRPGQRVLDVGAGTGTLAMLAKRTEAGAEVVGLDADPDIIGIARRKAADAGVELTFDEALANDMPYEDGSFDRVLSTLFFHHLMPADRRAAFAEIARVLRPGGELHLADWTRAADPLQAVLTVPGRTFDGFERTRECFSGKLPKLIADAGLRDASERRRFRTVYGTLGLVSATR